MRGATCRVLAPLARTLFDENIGANAEHRFPLASPAHARPGLGLRDRRKLVVHLHQGRRSPDARRRSKACDINASEKYGLQTHQAQVSSIADSAVAQHPRIPAIRPAQERPMMCPEPLRPPSRDRRPLASRRTIASVAEALADCPSLSFRTSQSILTVNGGPRESPR
jgi:hypothetical protein